MYIETWTYLRPRSGLEYSCNSQTSTSASRLYRWLKSASTTSSVTTSLIILPTGTPAASGRLHNVVRNHLCDYHQLEPMELQQVNPFGLTSVHLSIDRCNEVYNVVEDYCTGSRLIHPGADIGNRDDDVANDYFAQHEERVYPCLSQQRRTAKDTFYRPQTTHHEGLMVRQEDRSSSTALGDFIPSDSRQTDH